MLHHTPYIAAGANYNHPQFTHEGTAAARAHQLLLQTVSSAHSSPPFALLPLLLRSPKSPPATALPVLHRVRRQHHVKSPSFAAEPVYASLHKQVSPVFPMRMQRLQPVTVENQQALKTSAPSHPLYKYASLGRVQHIHSVPVAAASRSTLTLLHTYASLAQPVPANNHAAVTTQQSRQILLQFAQLNRKQPKRSGRQSMSTSVANNRTALHAYAKLGH